MDGTNRIDELEQKFIENPRRYFAPLANEYRKAGNPHQAIAICQAHLGQLPGHMSGQIVYGQALFEGGEYEKAQTVFENALAMDRENLVALRHLGDLALRNGETAAAKQWYVKFLEIDPKDAAVVTLVNEIDDATDAQTPASSDETPAEPAIPEPVESAAPAPAPAVVADSFHSNEEDKLIADELGYPVPPPGAFVTETMAELYLAQGFRDRALNVYRQLIVTRPDDERIKTRLAELEQTEPAVSDAVAEAPTASSVDASPAIEFDPPRVESRREDPPPIESPERAPDSDDSTSIEAPVPPAPEVEPPSEESPSGDSFSIDSPTSEGPASEPDSIESPSREEPRAEPEGVAAQLTVREFFAGLGRRRPSSGPGGGNGNGASEYAPGRDIFGDAPGTGSDEAAASALAGAFSTPSAAPQRETVPSPAASSSSGKESEEDVARFRAWLDGLTGQ